MSAAGGLETRIEEGLAAQLQGSISGAIASPTSVFPIPKTTERAYDRPSSETAALATLYAGLKREDCHWFDGPKASKVMGRLYTRLAVPDTTAAGAVAHFIVALAEWLDGASQVAWCDRPMLERHPDGHVSVVAVFAAWKGE